MSDEAQAAESPKDPLLNLNSLDLGPAWARGETEGQKSGEAKGRRRRDDDQERDRGRGEGKRQDGRDRDRNRGRRDDRRGDRRDDERGRRDDWREGRGDRGKRFQKGGRGRRDDDRHGSRKREEVVPPEGFTAAVMPVEGGLDGLAKEILAGGRTYSVFDLAKLVLGARERFNVTFRSSKETGGLVRCKKDGSLWLSREEALQHFWRADWWGDYYEEVVSETDPPRGNFQTVARCGISGELLGPPNYHGYQPALVQLHRERFGNMSLDAYKRKIKMERGEEAVAVWLEKMSRRLTYRPTGGVVPEVEEETEDESAVVEESVERTGELTAAGDETGGSDETGESGETTESGEASGPGESPPVEAAGPELVDFREVESHFAEHHFEDAFQETDQAWVGGNIRGNLLSPGLLTLLRYTVAEERRHPGKLTPILCRQLSGRHVAVFKWRRKLKAGPSRPHPVPDEIAIADRLMSLLSWITENSGRKLEHLWGDLLPNEIGDEEKTGWYHDLHWLLNQGYVLLMADSTIHRAKRPGDDEPKRSARKVAREKGKKPPAKGEKKARTKAAPAPPAPVEKQSRSGSDGRMPGLYALGGRKLGGSQHEVADLHTRGLRPRCNRPVEDEPESEGDSELPI